MRMTASWSGPKRTYRIQVCSAKSAPNREVPSDPLQTGTVQTPELCKNPLSQFIIPAACSGVKALPNTSAAKRQAAKLC